MAFSGRRLWPSVQFSGPIHSFSLLNDALSYGCAIFYASIHQLMNICVVSTFWLLSITCLLWITLLWTFMFKCLVNLCFNFSWRYTHTHTCTRVKLMGPVVTLYGLYIECLYRNPFANFQLGYFIIKLLASFLCNLNTSSLTERICKYFLLFYELSFHFLDFKKNCGK